MTTVDTDAELYDSTKPYRGPFGAAARVLHRDLERLHLESKGRELTEDEIRARPSLACAGKLEHRGVVKVRDDGSAYTDWYGDRHHTEIFCELCGHIGCVRAPDAPPPVQHDDDDW